MNRAERRRIDRDNRKKHTPTYNFTQEQLIAEIEKHAGHVKQEAEEDAVNTAMLLLFTIPLEILLEHYPEFRNKIQEFTSYIIEYYKKWQDDELDIEKMKADLWEYGGVRLEKE